MTVALYERVSTDEQVTQGFSLDAQKDRLESFCRSQGWSDFEHYTDDGYTGKNLDRPALKRLIRAVQRKDVSHVIVVRLDRLSRRQRDVLYLLEDVFDSNGVAFRSATEPFDTGTPLGRAMLGILAIFAQLERDTIIERTKSGLKQRVRQGLWHGAAYPFGYRMNLDTGILEVVPEEAALVKQAYEKFLHGESRAQIQRWLEKRTTARDVNTLFVRRLFTRQTYTGRLVLNGEVFEGQHAPIIDLDTFNRVQVRLKNIVVPRGGQRHLLSGLMVCGVCGSGMHYWEVKQRKPSGKEYRYMRVICQRKRFDRSCNSKSILAREVEDATIDQILSTPLDVDFDTEDSAPTAHVAQLEKRLDELDSERRRLVDAVRQGVLPLHIVKEDFDALERERKAIVTQLDDIPITDSRVGREQAIQLITQVREAWKDIDDEDRALMVRTVIQKVHVFPDKHVVVDLGI